MKRNRLLLIAAIIGTLYGIYLINYFIGGINSTIGTEQIGAELATMIVMPHMVMVWIAVIFNWLGFIFRLRWSALVAGILYAVAIVLFFMYFMFVVVEMILCFIAYGKMKKQNVEA